MRARFVAVCDYPRFGFCHTETNRQTERALPLWKKTLHTNTRVISYLSRFYAALAIGPHKIQLWTCANTLHNIIITPQYVDQRHKMLWCSSSVSRLIIILLTFLFSGTLYSVRHVAIIKAFRRRPGNVCIKSKLRKKTVMHAHNMV